MDALLKSDPLPCVIDGKPHMTGNTYDVVDPHKPSRIVHKVSCASKADVVAAIDSAAKALPSWRQTSAMERRRIFLKAAQLVRDKAADFAKIEVNETTSAEGWAMFGAALTADALEELAGVVTAALRSEIATTEHGKTAFIDRVPYGVVLGIAPWNAPLILGMRSVSNAIIGGNTAVLKTSEYSPAVQMIISAVFQEAGLPPGVLNVVHISTKEAPQLVEAMIAHPEVGKVNFTGSTVVGAKIAEVCGRHLKPCVMELGGKAAVVVTPEADLKLAANNITFGFCFHQGQICMATNTAIVHSSIYSDFVSALRAVVPSSTKGQGLFTSASASRSESIVKDALDKGAKALIPQKYEGIQNKGKDEGQNVLQPTVLEGLDPNMRIYGEELFSPVLGLVKYETPEEAIKIANSSEFGLSAGVWSKDHGAALRMAREIQSGMVHINGPTIHDPPQMPHGGIKRSGFGRFNGVEGIREFTQTKVITMQEGHEYPV